MTAIWTLRTRRAAGPASDDRDALRDVETRASARCVICVCAPSDNRPAGGPASRTNCCSALGSPTSRAAARSRMQTTPTNSRPRASSPRTSSHRRDRRPFSEYAFKLPQGGELVRLERATLHGRPIDLAHANDLPATPRCACGARPCLPRVGGSAECHGGRTSWCWAVQAFVRRRQGRAAG